MKTFKTHILILVFPLMVLALGIFAVIAFDCYSCRSIDPEFPYLLNGLNVARLESGDIGHFDHPGTPFQVFIGIAIRIIHLLTGEGSLTHDVLSRHQHYLSGVSLIITALTGILIYMVGLRGLKHGIHPWKILVLQAGTFLSDLLVWNYIRVIPERWIMITALLFFLVYIEYGYKNRNLIKFAVWSGVVMGLGMATKFNFLPSLLLPLLLLNSTKTSLYYGGSLVASFVFFVSPILQHFKHYARFISSIIKHDGLYGSGEARVINTEKIGANLRAIFEHMPELLLWIVLIIMSLAFAIRLHKKKDQAHYIRLFAAFLLVFAVQILMVAKHYKAYYLIPAHTLFGFVLFIFGMWLSENCRTKWLKAVIVGALLFVFVSINALRIARDYEYVMHQQQLRTEINEFVNKHMPEQPAWFVEPVWLSGPHEENALVFGLSYSRNRHKYLPQLMEINPNMITYEGDDRPVKSWRGKEADLDSLVAANTRMYVYDTPGRNAIILLNLLEASAERSVLELKVDTIFSQAETGTNIIRASAGKMQDL